MTDAAALTSAFEELRKGWGPIAAVVHGAGVLADKRISEKTTEQFDRVFETKVAGLEALLTATANDPLKVLFLFSSVAARCGNLGQCDYAMANEVLNKVAVAEARRRGDSCLVRSLGWGPWEGGMVSPQLKARFEAMGLVLIGLDAGAKMLSDEAASLATSGADSASHAIELVLGGEPRPEALLAEGESRSLRVDVLVGRTTHPYLDDHAISGTPVVPVAFVIEWFARTARAFCPDLMLAGLDRLEVLRGIPLHRFDDGEEHLVVDCRATPTAEDGTVRLHLELSDGTGKIFYRASADMADGHQVEGPADAGHAELGFEEWSQAELYQGGVLFHGPRFQMLSKINGISDHGIAADLTGVLSPGWGRGATLEPWCTDPLVFDGGLQLALLWCERVLGGASLPTGIASVRTWLKDPAPGPFSCTLRGRSAVGSKSVSDARFFDASGRLVAELSGIETHLLPGQSARRS